MVICFVAWWNLENLFDYENSRRRTSKLRRALGNSIEGWTPKLRDIKIDQLAKAIAALNNGLGPDLLGMCEVENEWVVKRLRDRISHSLPDRDFGVVHADLHDQRGIDIAFLYDQSLLEVPDGEVFQHVVMRRNATRAILQVNFKTRPGGDTWTVFGNHWPSRSGGQYQSEGYRQIAGETLAYFHLRALQVHGDDTPVLVMGDFNDEPWDSSLVRHALSQRQLAKVLEAATAPHLWNLAWLETGRARGTFYWDNHANVLDQFLVGKNMVAEGSRIRVEVDTYHIEDGFPGLMDVKSPYPKPVPFGGMGNPVNPDGFSDHFPISIRVLIS